MQTVHTTSARSLKTKIAPSTPSAGPTVHGRGRILSNNWRFEAVGGWSSLVRHTRGCLDAMQYKAASENDHTLVGKNIVFTERPTCSIAEACRAVGIGRTKLYELIDEELVESVKIGRRRLVRIPSLLHYLSMHR